MGKVLKKYFMLTASISIFPIFFIVRYFEKTNVFDSIGVFYTIYVSLIFSIALSAIITLAKWLAIKQRG